MVLILLLMIMDYFCCSRASSLLASRSLRDCVRIEALVPPVTSHFAELHSSGWASRGSRGIGVGRRRIIVLAVRHFDVRVDRHVHFGSCGW